MTVRRSRISTRPCGRSASRRSRACPRGCRAGRAPVRARPPSRRPLRVPAAPPRPRRGARVRPRRSCPTRGSRSTSCAASRRRRSSSAAPPGPERRGRALFQAVLLPLLVSTARGLRRLRLGGRRVRPRLPRRSSTRSSATRAYRALHAGGSARRPLGRGCSHDRACARGIRRSSASTDFGADPERDCVTGVRAGAPLGPTRPPRRSRRVRRRGHRAPARNGGASRRRPARPRAARLATRWIPAAARDRGDRSPGGEPSRLDPWRGKLAGELLGSLPGSEHDGELGEALERWELSLFESEPLRSDRLREALVRAPRRRRRALGCGDAGGRAGRRDHRAGSPRPDRRDPRACPAVSVRMRRPRTPSGGSSSRPFSPTTGRGSSRPSTRRCSGCGGGPRASSRRGRARRDAIGTELPRSRASRPSTVGRWRRRGVCWRGWSGSRRSTGSVRSPETCSPSCGRCCPRRRPGRGPSGRSGGGDRCRGAVPGDAPAGKHGRNSSRTLLA